MVLLSRELQSSQKMNAELVPDESPLGKDNSFALVDQFTNNHQINLVVEEKHKQQASFVTKS